MTIRHQMGEGGRRQVATRGCTQEVTEGVYKGGERTMEEICRERGRVCDMVYQSMLKHTHTDIHTHTHLYTQRYKASISDKKSTTFLHMTLSLFYIISPLLSSCFLLYFSINVCVCV